MFSDRVGGGRVEDMFRERRERRVLAGSARFGANGRDRFGRVVREI